MIIIPSLEVDQSYIVNLHSTEIQPWCCSTARVGRRRGKFADLLLVGAALPCFFLYRACQIFLCLLFVLLSAVLSSGLALTSPSAMSFWSSTLASAVSSTFRALARFDSLTGWQLGL